MSLIPRSIRLAPQDSYTMKHQTNLVGEVVYNTDNTTLVVFDGKKAGGHPLLKADLSNASVQYKSVFTGTTPPEDVEYGTIWFNSHNGNLYVYTQTATTGIWVQPSSPSFGSLNRDIGPDASTLDGNTLASNVTASSLTSVGTLTGLTVASTIHGDITGNAGTVTNGIYTTGHYNDPSWITGLAGSKVVGPVSSVTNGVYTTDTGTVTNNMLAGNISPSKLATNYFTLNGVQVPLGGRINTADLVGQNLSMTSAPTFNGLYVTGSIHTGNLVVSGAIVGLPTASEGTLGVVRVDGTSIVISGGVISANYTLPTASTDTLGGVKVDGTTITINDGVISGQSMYQLPPATNYSLGGVKVDGITINIDPSGTISGANTYTLPIAKSYQVGYAADLSSSSVTIRNVGNVDTVPIYPPGGAGFSLSLPGSSDSYFQIDPASKLRYTGTTWTVETWFKVPYSFQSSYSNIWSSPVQYIQLATAWSGTAGWTWYDTQTGGGGITTSAADIGDDQWHHIAIVRNGSSLKMYGDGVLKASKTTTESVIDFGQSGYSRIGSGTNNAPDNYFTGVIYGFRISKVARYTAAFTPSATYTSDSNTLLMVFAASPVYSTLGGIVPDGTSLTVNEYTGVASAPPPAVFTSTQIAIGLDSGQYYQSPYTVAIGGYAGNYQQGQLAVAIGNGAAQASQAPNATAVGAMAGFSGQGSEAVSLGFMAGYTTQGYASIAVGSNAGYSSQSSYSIAIGYQAGNTIQSNNSIAIGYVAGNSSQNAYAVAIGDNAGYMVQGTGAVAVGQAAGNYLQGAGGVAIGNSAGNSQQQSSAVAIGPSAGQTSQSGGSVAIGASTAGTNQSYNAVAIGTNAAYNTQSSDAVAIGNNAGYNTQSTGSIAIGSSAGYFLQNSNSVAIGVGAGAYLQGSSAVSIGYQAGYNSQGKGAIAIGTAAGYDNQAAHSIVINAGDNQLNAANPGFYVYPVRQDTTSNTAAVYFNTTTNELTYSVAFAPSVSTITSSGTITPVGYNGGSQYNVTALSQATTITPPSGAAVDGQPLTIRIKDNGTGRALTWNTAAGGYRIIGVTLPTTTVANKTLYVRCIYNATDNYWDVLNVNQQA